MITEQPRSQTYLAFQAGAALRYRLPVRTGTRVTRILGRPRVTGVELTDAAGRVSILDCDTVVFTGDWIPDHELARRFGLRLDRGTRGPVIDSALGTSQPGVYAVGNLIHPVLTADQAALDGRHVGRVLPRWLASPASAPAASVAINVADPLRWISPNLLRVGAGAPPRGRLTAWSNEFVRRPRFEVRQDGRLLHRERHLRTLVPQRPYDLGAGWLAQASAEAGPVEVAVDGI